MKPYEAPVYTVLPLSTKDGVIYSNDNELGYDWFGEEEGN